VLPVSGFLTKPAHDEGTDLGDPFEVAVDVDDAEVMVERRLGDEQIGDRDAVPHPMVMREVTLQPQRSFENVRWGGSDPEVAVKLTAPCVVVSR
jgi:hypothetical protein